MKVRQQHVKIGPNSCRHTKEAALSSAHCRNPQSTFFGRPAAWKSSPIGDISRNVATLSAPRWPGFRGWLNQRRLNIESDAVPTLSSGRDCSTSVKACVPAHRHWLTLSPAADKWWALE